ncbi:MAG: succinate dehydrogenase, hydrophobic membrane anchor protein [Oceanococcaceae bacterium]
MSYRSPLGAARGLGSAKSGTGHWMAQRLTAVAMIPLTLWFVWSLLCMADASHEEMTLWLSTPLAATLMCAYALILFYHAALGLQVVIEDYVGGAARLVSIVAVKLLAALGALACVVSVLLMAIGN